MSDESLPYQPSLASATNTRVDSACKHHHQCRVSTDDLLGMMIPVNDAEELKRNKYRYCAHKDELIVGVGRPWAPEESRKKMNNAYPRVISNLGMMDGTTESSKIFQKMITYMYHYCCSLDDKQNIIRWFRSRDYTIPEEYGHNQHNDVLYFPCDEHHKLKENTHAWLSKMYDYTTMGYSQTLGYAHPTVGDTMTTVMIGGMRTVMNGDFPVENGDEIQWYWPFEKDCFHKNGTRKKFLTNHEWNNDGTYIPCNVNPTIEWTMNGNDIIISNTEKLTLSKDAEQRHQYHNKIYGQPSGKDKVVAFIKPYYKDYDHPRMYDQMRVFAKAIGSCRPHEMCDIKICRQSL